MFGSATNYVAQRILGVDKDDERMVKARKWMHDNGKRTLPLKRLLVTNN